jgi:hypothetical protein
MATQVQYRRGSGAQVAAFTGALGEMVVDTTNYVLNVADGVTVGGFSMVGVTATQTLTNKTLTAPVIGGNANITGNIIGTGAISITGNITVGNIFAAVVGNVSNIGTSSQGFNTIFAKATSAQYADLAEMYVADQSYSPGTVIEFGGTEEVTASQSSHSTAVAGIVSTNPSYLMNATQTGNHVVAVALVGRVPCQVIGTFKKGDRLVASDITGVATGLDMSKYQPGCIIGKALEAYCSNEVGVVEVAVGRN